MDKEATAKDLFLLFCKESGLKFDKLNNNCFLLKPIDNPILFGTNDISFTFFNNNLLAIDIGEGGD